MSEGGEKPPADDFDARLRAARGSYDARYGKRDANAGKNAPRTSMEGVGYAIRLGAELVAGILVGVAIGYGLDYWLGTKPWLMIVFLFLGGAAGISNVYRVASGMGSGIGWRRPEDGDGDGNGHADGTDDDRPDGGRRD
jgi:ATP synthase protein I